MVFRKVAVNEQNIHWYYAGQELEIVNLLNYLGLSFSSGGLFMQHAKYLSDKALKTMRSLFDITKDVDTPVNAMLPLFDSLVASILNYRCESLGIFKRRNC